MGTKVDFPKVGFRAHKKVWINTPMFKNIWDSIKADGAYKKYQWTVKVDAIEDLYLFKDAVCDMIEAKSKKAKETGMKYTAIKMEPKVQTCEGDKAIAFHPLKKPYDYFTCVKNAQA